MAGGLASSSARPAAALGDLRAEESQHQRAVDCLVGHESILAAAVIKQEEVNLGCLILRI